MAAPTSVLRKRIAARSKARPLAFARGFYACYYGAGAFLSPFLVLYYSDLGLNGRQIGLLRSIAPLISVVGAPLWGALADYTQQHRLVRLITIAGSWLAVLALALGRTYGVLVACVVFYAAFAAPVIPLVDNAVISVLGADRARYGKQRLWGAIGWGGAGVIAGLIIERLGLTWAFIGHLVFMAGAGVMALGIPAARMATSEAGIADECSDPCPASPRGHPVTSEHRAFSADLRQLVSDRAWLAFLFAVLVGSLFLSVEMSYLFLYLETLGVSESLMGVALAIGTISEVPVWFLAPRLLKRLGARGLLAIALTAGIVQALAYGCMPTIWVVLAVQLLHGLSFSAMWSAGVAYAADAAPAGTAATAQGVFGGVKMGLSAAIGAYAGGVLLEQVGGAQTFLLTVVTSVIALVLVLFSARSREHRL